ncbi:phosphotransferase [Streptomyces flavochromogenes]|uniref:Phosphotransferase n=1 Tax=Streptomyces flavochromogenes TaxID=68199 RepID=A0ABW6XWA5_9ACTN|nr:phosphotransferase [Streptomyces flavochromogenes]
MDTAFPRAVPGERPGTGRPGWSSLLPLDPSPLLTRPSDLVRARRLAGLLRGGHVRFRDLHRLERTVSDLLVFRLEDHTAEPLVIKHPRSGRAAGSLTHGCAALRELAEDDRVGEWRRLLPSAEELRYDGRLLLVAERCLPGVEGDALLRRAPGRAWPLAVAALGAVAALHRATGRPERAERRTADWVDTRLAVLTDQIPWCGGPRGAAAVRALRERLNGGLAGRTLTAARTHGDYHPGNILVNEESGTLSGVIDWADSLPDGPCAVDSYLFVLTLRQQRERRELGQIVADAVRRGGLLPEDRALLGHADVPPPGQEPDEALMPLLTWLWHVAGNAAKSARYGRSRRWVTGNVVPVLTEVARR